MSGHEFGDYAATIIQKVYRGYRVRKTVKRQVPAAPICKKGSGAAGFPP